MCGRYEFVLDASKKGRQIKERAEKLHLVFKQGEIFPDDDVLCIIPVETRIDLKVMKWGIRNKSFQINARMESINDRPSYAEMKKRRCAVICNGFYEWNKDKEKYYISTDDDYVYLACIFNDNDELLIITQAADEEFSRIHERKPIIMNQQEMLMYVHDQDGTISPKKLNYTLSSDAISLF